MKNFSYILIFVLLVSGCKNTEKEQYQATSSKEDFSKQKEHPGKKLMETNCYLCHDPSTDHDSRIAPPMIAVKKHYLTNNITKEEFIASFQNWIKNPTQENSKMYGAVKKFGVMPNTPYPEKTIYQIADYIFDNKIEQPEWFEAHYNEERGKGLGQRNGLQKRERKGQNQSSLQLEFDKTNKTYSEIGLHYALSTKKQLGKNLMGTIQKKGTIEALIFCNERAYPLTDSMATVHNAVIKRVSDKPRNQQNSANEIELKHIEKFKTLLQEGKEIEPIVVENDENVNFYYPITTNSMCLQCHGKVNEQINSKTYTKIKALYPDDKAIAYDVNNVRGIWSIKFKK